MKKNENDKSGSSPLSYKLIIRDHQASEKKGEPDLILRKQPSHLDQKVLMDTARPKDNTPADSVSENNCVSENNSVSEDAGQKNAESIASAGSVADYISSLQNHIPDDVNRVVDAIIAEEGKIPTNLPRLDDQLTMIYPGSDVQNLPGEDLFYEREKTPAKETKSGSYTNRVEYEDL